MDLILWRHAEAQDGVPDMERKLTSKGQKQADKMATFLRARLPNEVRILVSPAKRTQQTALALTKHFSTEDYLAPGNSAEDILTSIGWPDSDETVLLVGHQPVLGQIAAKLLANIDAGFSVKKGSIWWLSCHSSEGDFQTNLRLAITPDAL